ncbi:ParB/RepB/Spo0J family partition protein [Lysinibacter cavernae]|uniref:ParB family chromosome partitioning protein n=1 Tax=Lysinibacter cavernae TaxID=1640652 RepID=A0A7X5TSK7_9MICO|nr:ParB/RepB/Spo0J family partition protein [Lysinibacter cavernae]NIH52524.1 ParB family chromosome partitioning protein [Lysinibacter cavernae]
MTGTIEHIDPRELIIAANVRKDVKLKPEFVSSIRESGILSPPMVTHNKDGALEVVLGQRRTLAAIEAGLETMPVYVVGESEANAARVIDQLAENEQREELSDAERLGGYRELAMFGLSAGDIAKSTGTSKTRVETALSIAAVPAAVEAVAEKQLTLEQGAIVADFCSDFADDEELIAELLAAEPDEIERNAPTLRREATLRAQAAVVRADAEDAGLTVLDVPLDSMYVPLPVTDEGYVRLGRYAFPATPSAEISSEEAALIEGVVIRICRDWGVIDGVNQQVAQAVFYVPEAAAEQLVPKQYDSSSGRTDEEQAAYEAERVRRELERQRASDAKEARVEFAVQVLQRKGLPGQWADFAALALAHDARESVNIDGLAEAIGIKSGYPGDTRGVTELALKKRGNRYLLALGFDAAERTLGHVPAFLVTYFGWLVAWGYAMSEFEMELLREAHVSIAGEDADEVVDGADEAEGEAE